jgi:scyllo-inositol 2-dehydrogenase (NADP+)
MGVVVVGLGNQGRKRQRIVGDDVTATVDPINQEAQYRHIEDVPLESFDRALVCTPDGDKIGVMRYLLTNGKHVLVEKPLISADEGELRELQQLADRSGTACYTAYNHRFEPHLMAMKELIEEEGLGKIYLARLFYGNGTARDVRNSPWRDTGLGVLGDLGSHLLDLAAFCFGYQNLELDLWSHNRFENQAPDHVLLGGGTSPVLEMEMTLLSWKNEFRFDVYGELGTAHVDGLCKWGPSHFCTRTRVQPSGKPDEKTVTVEKSDPTWEAEYNHFNQLCEGGRTSLDGDIWVNRTLLELSKGL